MLLHVGGIHGAVFPTLVWMSQPHLRADIPSLFLLRLAGFPNASRMPQAGSQPAYLSEKNSPALPCHTPTREDGNLLPRNISNNCLENRCLSSFTCNQHSLPCPFPARTLVVVPWFLPCFAPPRPGTGVRLVPWHDLVQKMLPLHMTHHTTRKPVPERQQPMFVAWENFVSLAK